MDNTDARQSSTLAYFVLAIGFIYLMQAPAALAKLGVFAGDPEQYGGLTALGIFSPLLAATFLAWREARRAGVRALYVQLLQWRASPAWYLAALLVPPLLMAAALFLYDPSGSRPYYYLPDRAARIVALVLIPVVEELGWRGYALPRLLRAHRPLVASVILGAGWWLWHLPMFTLQDFTAEQFMLSLLLLLSGSVVYTWLYLRSGGGLSIALAAHAGAHLSNSSIPLPADSVPLAVQAASFCFVALLLVLLERKTEPMSALTAK
jgi:membrane protease YdiL (CAAX protease family)